MSMCSRGTTSSSLGPASENYQRASGSVALELVKPWIADRSARAASMARASRSPNPAWPSIRA